MSFNSYEEYRRSFISSPSSDLPTLVPQPLPDYVQALEKLQLAPSNLLQDLFKEKEFETQEAVSAPIPGLTMQDLDVAPSTDFCTTEGWQPELQPTYINCRPAPKSLRRIPRTQRVLGSVRSTGQVTEGAVHALKKNELRVSTTVLKTVY
ncbi:unnamed protein product [Caenorhabditis brenneri]